MSMEEIYKIVVMIFTVSNLAAMGLEINPKEAARTLKNPRFVLLILIWGWVVGPAVAWLLTKVIPLSEPHAAGLLLISMAPTAPFFPLMVSKARGDMSSAGAFILVATIGTVVFLPLQVPLLIKGLTVETWALAKPLLTMVLLPLLDRAGDQDLQSAAGRQTIAGGQENRNRLSVDYGCDDRGALLPRDAQRRGQLCHWCAVDSCSLF